MAPGSNAAAVSTALPTGGEVAAGLAAAALCAEVGAATPVLARDAAVSQCKPTRCSRCLGLGHSVRTDPLASGVTVSGAAPAAVHAHAITASTDPGFSAALASATDAGAAAGGTAALCTAGTAAACSRQAARLLRVLPVLRTRHTSSRRWQYAATRVEKGGHHGRSDE